LNDPHPSVTAAKTVDPKVERDWANVEARRAEINSRDGGDTRRQAIMRRLGLLKHAS
jgi:hypothetical protein